MGLAEATGAGFRKYATFGGRARRSEFWWFSLALLLIYGAAVLLAFVLDAFILIVIVALAIFLPSTSVTVRRLHDTGRSGLWYFISYVPLIGPIWLLVLMCLDSQASVNFYGPSPKYDAAAVGA